MSELGFYRRPLPAGQIPFASDEGRAIFREAMASGGLEGYFALAEQFHTQSEPAFCGLGTLVVALNALAVDPGRVWRGPWRWYGEEMLDCCEPLERVRERGLTLGQLACLARCNGAGVELRRAGETSVAAFSAELTSVAGTVGGKVLVASYARTELDQTGEGHFSPIGGYHAGRDLALVLDVARFKYPPHWVPVQRLFEAMCSIDPASGRTRGWLLLTRGRGPSPLVYFVSCKEHPWADIAERLTVALPRALAEARPPTLDAALAVLLLVLGPIASAFAPRPAGSGPQREAAEALLDAIRATEAYRRIAAISPELPAEAGALLVLSAPLASFAPLSPEVLQSLRDLRDPARLEPGLGEEITQFAQQLQNLLELGTSPPSPVAPARLEP